MPIVSKNANWQIKSSHGKIINEGTVPEKSNSAGAEITFEFTSFQKKYNYVSLVLEPLPSQKGSGDQNFWNHYSPRIGGEPLDNDTFFRNIYLQDGKGHFSVTLTADKKAEFDLGYRLYIYDESGPYTPNPIHLISTTFNLVDDDGMRGTAASDRITGTNKNDLIVGLAGNDIIGAGAGHDRVDGGLGNDKISGVLGSDRVWGGGGNDTLRGGDGNDTLWGDVGNDVILGDEGHDALIGGAGNDVFGGGNGYDCLLGKAGNDVLNGGLGNDKLFGGTGNDTLVGGAGNDILVFGRGFDVLTGGAGADTFVFHPKERVARITDFEAGKDGICIVFDGSVTYSDQPVYRQVGNHTHMKIADTTVVFENTKMSQIDGSFAAQWGPDPFAEPEFHYS